MKRILLAAAAILSAVNMSLAQTQIDCMRTCGLDEPLGIDQTPKFSWTVQDKGGYGFVQESYSITVSNAETGETVWQSGDVTSPLQSDIRYEGKALESRNKYTWSVAVKNTRGEIVQSDEASFETAFLSPGEWSAKWIGHKRDNITSRMEVRFDKPVEAGHLKIDISKLGLQAEGDWNYYYAQFAEVQIFSGSTNVALSAKFTPSSAYPANANWRPEYINDGVIGSDKIGYTSASFTSQRQNVTLRFDFDKTYTIDRIVLYPRQDTRGRGNANAAANFPSSFTIATSADGAKYDQQYVASDIAAPEFKAITDEVPYYAKQFSVAGGKEIASARIYASALGVFTMNLNGQPVTENRLEPGESAYDKTLFYSTYDVTSLLREGRNTLLAQVAGGLYSVLQAPGRYSKPEIKNTGIPALIAELFVEYTDGTTDHIVTDGTWRTAPSPVTATNWWGGEDYDANLEAKENDIEDWAQAEVVSPVTNLPIEKGGANAIGTLCARRHEPIRVVEEWKAVSVKQHSNGHYIVDFGQNFAGQFEFVITGKAGQTVKCQTGEQLNSDGTVNAQGYYGGEIMVYDTYTFAKDTTVRWTPQFMYHGFRYMEVAGLDYAPSVSDLTALRMRTNVGAGSSFVTSNSLINDIHRICRNSIASQMFNVFTDCPQREKIGWLDVPNLMYNSITYNFDFQTLCHKIAQDCFDAQAATGKVPSTVPHFMTDWDDDPNWGGSAILVPYRTWKTYGDTTLISRHYDGMKRLADYYTSLTTGYIMPGSSYSGLSDWGQGSSGLANPTAAEFTITCTYYYLLRVMAEVAVTTGRDADAAAFNALADKVKDAFNARFYDKAKGVYAHGNQAEYAMPLYYGLADADQEEKVARKLADQVIADNYRIKTGEVGLKPVLMMLAKYGYNDIVWKVANTTDYPSYGYFVVNGCTTTPEYWDLSYSQNHCMMDHIEEWFYSQLAGVQNVGTGYDNIRIAPYVPADLNSLTANVSTVRGVVTSAFARLSDGIRYKFSVPANSKATIHIRIPSGKRVFMNGAEVKAGDAGILSVAYADTACTMEVLSGDYEFTAGDGDEVRDEIVNERMWLKLGSMNSLTESSVIRIKDASTDRYIGECAQFPIAAGNYLTGATRGMAAEMVVGDVEAAKFTLSDPLSGLGVGGHPTWDYMIAWQNSSPYQFGLDFAADGVKVYRSKKGTTARGYLFFTDGGAHSGISSVSTQKDAPLWEVHKLYSVNDSAGVVIKGCALDKDIIHYERTLSRSGRYETIVLPFDLAQGDKPANYQFVIPTEIDGSTIRLAETEGLKGGIPYLVRYVADAAPTSETVNLVGVVTSSVPSSSTVLSGTYAMVDAGQGQKDNIAAFVLNDEGTAFVRANTASVIYPFRAYLKADASVDSYMLDSDIATAIVAPDSEAEAQPAYYSITGQRLPSVPASGLYLVRQGGKVVKVFAGK